ncbi:MAG TPA: DUF362 domain-containing protein [Candidatus Acidoferrales bacterium]|nr:DUF362 domain-containing protein [Candidatus Acidoferrales bacterium]
MSVSNSQLLPSFKRPDAQVAIRRAEGYQANLSNLIYETLNEFGVSVRGQVVLLKANFVGPDPRGVVNTHPAVVGAARECFLRLGAKEVIVADGPALERDTEGILEMMRLREFIGPLAGSFVDLNIGDVRCVPLRTRASSLRELYLPEAVLRADFIVSMPKLKTHHWAGVTLSLKNMFGIVPGSCYGWPKNILHWAGITRAVLDITSTVRPDFAIVDGILGMEGNGPIQGVPKPCGVLVMGNDPVAVDATCARIMGLVPERIEHLAQASYLLGHLRDEKIRQIGESVASVRTPFEVLPSFRRLRAGGRHRGHSNCLA